MKATLLILFLIQFQFQLMDNKSEIKNELIEYGFDKEHIELVLKITDKKQEAVDLYITLLK